MDDYISKPVRPEELQGALERRPRARVTRRAAPAEAPSTEVIASLRELQDPDEPDFVTELIDAAARASCRRGSPPSRRGRRGRRATVNRIAHSMKSSCGNLGRRPLADPVRGHRAQGGRRRPRVGGRGIVRRRRPRSSSASAWRWPACAGPRRKPRDARARRPPSPTRTWRRWPTRHERRTCCACFQPRPTPRRAGLARSLGTAAFVAPARRVRRGLRGLACAARPGLAAGRGLGPSGSRSGACRQPLAARRRRPGARAEERVERRPCSAASRLPMSTARSTVAGRV